MKRHSKAEQIERLTTMENRVAFWRYCIKAAFAAQERAKKKGVPFSIDAYYLEQLMVDQGWRCALSDIPFSVKRRDPFGPSLDRIVPSLGYVAGNLRFVNHILNTAMSNWGIEIVLQVAKAVADKNRTRPEPLLKKCTKAKKINSEIK